jgi:Fimbrial assembly protein (PilN)
MRAVNLLPRDEGRKRTPAEAAPVVVGLALLLVATVFCAFSFLSASASVRDKRSALGDAERQLAVLPPLPPGPTPIEAGLASEQSSRVSAVASALSRRVTWDRVLREFATVLPTDVWLTSLGAKSPSSPASAAPAAPAAPNAAATGFVVNGYTYSQAGVARLLSRLSVLPDLQNVQLQTSALSKIGEQQVVQFTIVADLTPLGAAS